MLTYHYSGSFPVRGGVMVGAGGMETWGGRRSAAYASMCGPPLPFSRRACRVQAGFTESTWAASYPVPSGRVHESGHCQAIPIHRPYSHPLLT